MAQQAGTEAGSTSARVAAVEVYGEPLRLRDVPVPEPEPGALVVSVAATTICGSDLHIVDGDVPKGIAVTPPLVPGHEVVGRIVAIGDGAEVDSIGQPLSIGDRVIWTAAPCRRCYICTIRQEPSLCRDRVLGAFQSCEQFPYITGTFADHSYVYPTAGRLRVPDELPDHWASAASCALRTALRVIEVLGGIEPHEHAVVQGAGPVGLCAVAVLAAHSPASLTVIGAPDDRLEVARAWGATHALSVETADAAARQQAVLDITDGRGADVILDCAGAPGVIAEGIDLAAVGGRYGICGTVGGSAQPIDVQRITLKGLHLHGVFSADVDAYWKALQFMRDRRETVDWELLFGNHYALADIDAALDAMRSGREIKPVIVP